MTSREAVYKMVEKYEMLGREHCKLARKNTVMYEVNQEVFDMLACQVLADLDLLEKLKQENAELKKLKEEQK
nr:MAG TPA: hypothetical protein [Caudoviricetes sp.]